VEGAVDMVEVVAVVVEVAVTVWVLFTKDVVVVELVAVAVWLT
jgi:hypothetical protein